MKFRRKDSYFNKNDQQAFKMVVTKNKMSILFGPDGSLGQSKEKYAHNNSTMDKVA